MIFNDPFFLFVFLPLAAFAFHWLGKRFGATAGLGVIFVGSILFYLPWGWWMTALLLVSVLVNFAIGSILIAEGPRRGRLALLLGGEFYNFAILAVFKYQLLSGVLGSSGTWVIPAGISFYTFHQAAFLADAYAREPSVVAYLGNVRSAATRVQAFVRYAAFVTFFPQLVIGPITYMHEFQPQVQRRGFGRVTYVNLSVGFALIALGLFKKIVIADHFDGRVDQVFAAAAEGTPLHPYVAWLGVLSFYIQLYFDFSGYSDAALGLARIFGIRYPMNFFSPLKAVGIIDFYRRWHMTLTRVVSRFLFTPLSIWGTRRALQRRYSAALARLIGTWLPLGINFEVIGLWHGATSTFVLFGLLHGIWYIAETEVRRSRWWKAWRKRSSNGARATLGRILFFALMPVTFALFRCDSIGTFGFLLQQLAGAGIGTPWPGHGTGRAVFLGLAMIYLLPNSIEFMRRYRPALATYVNPSYGPRWLQFAWRPSWFWTGVIGAMALACIYYMNRQSPFLYQGF